MVANSKLSDEQWDLVYDWIVDGTTVTECIKLIKKEFNVVISYAALNKHRHVLAAKEARESFLDQEALDALDGAYAKVINSLVETIEFLTAEQIQLRTKLLGTKEGQPSYKTLTDRLGKVEAQLGKSNEQFMELHKELKQTTKVIKLVTKAQDEGVKDDVIKSLLVTLERKTDKSIN